MKKQGRKVRKVAMSSSKLTATARKAKNSAKKKTKKAKVKAKSMLNKARRKLKGVKIAKTLRNAKNKVYASEKEIMEYVKENPVKSLSAVALTGLIAKFITSRYK